jgi:molecular chaperone GrpE
MQARLTVLSLAFHGGTNLAIKDQEVEKNDTASQVEENKETCGNIEATRTDSRSEKHSRQLEALRGELELEQRKSTDLANRMRYLQADIANLQRQSDRRVSEVRTQVKLTWILEVLSIKEDLDRALGVAKESQEKSSSLLDGLLLVISRIENILKLESVEMIRADVGSKFDPSVHEALAFQETDHEEQGTILAVISPGYSVDGKVIKPAMVEVARRKEKPIKEEFDRLVDGGPSSDLEIEEKSNSKKP